MPFRRLYLAGCFAFGAIGAALLTLGLTGGQDKGAWIAKAPAPTKRTEVAAAALRGRIYVVGGFTRGLSMISAATEEYDPATDSWRQRASLPSGLHHAGIGVVNDRLYVIGGYAHSLLTLWEPTAGVYEYNPAADQWTRRKPMPTARGALAVAVHNGKVHAVGGYTKDANTGAHEMYDPASDSWTTLAPLPVPRDHLAAAALGGRLFAIGGRLNGQYSQNVAVTEAYDPATDRWARKADLPTARSGITAAVLGNRIHIFGGEAPAGTFRENEAYDPATDKWETYAPIPTARHGLGSAVIDGRAYLLCGGPTPGGSFSDLNEVFLPGLPASAR